MTVEASTRPHPAPGIEWGFRLVRRAAASMWESIASTVAFGAGARIRVQAMSAEWLQRCERDHDKHGSNQ